MPEKVDGKMQTDTYQIKNKLISNQEILQEITKDTSEKHFKRVFLRIFSLHCTRYQTLIQALEQSSIHICTTFHPMILSHICQESFSYSTRNYSRDFSWNFIADSVRNFPMNYLITMISPQITPEIISNLQKFLVQSSF